MNCHDQQNPIYTFTDGAHNVFGRCNIFGICTLFGRGDIFGR